jgi:hypothetical protein
MIRHMSEEDMKSQEIDERDEAGRKYVALCLKAHMSLQQVP